MFEVRDKRYINRQLLKVERYLQTYREDSDELQYLWQAVIHLQIALDRIPAEGE